MVLLLRLEDAISLPVVVINIQYAPGEHWRQTWETSPPCGKPNIACQATKGRLADMRANNNIEMFAFRAKDGTGYQVTRKFPSLVLPQKYRLNISFGITIRP